MQQVFATFDTEKKGRLNFDQVRKSNTDRSQCNTLRYRFDLVIDLVFIYI